MFFMLIFYCQSGHNSDSIPNRRREGDRMALPVGASDQSTGQINPLALPSSNKNKKTHDER